MATSAVFSQQVKNKTELLDFHLFGQMGRLLKNQKYTFQTYVHKIMLIILEFFSNLDNLFSKSFNAEYCFTQL